MTRSVSFRQSDLTRAYKAAAQASIPIVRTHIEPDGTIVLLHSQSEAAGRDVLQEWMDAQKDREPLPTAQSRH